MTSGEPSSEEIPHSQYERGGEFILKPISENRYTKIIRNLVLIGVPVTIIVRLLAWMGERVVEESGIDPNQDPIEAERKTAIDKTNDFDFRQIARIGLDSSGIDLNQISNPEIISPVFLRMSAEFGGDWLLPPAINEAGQITDQVSEAVFNDWVTALQLDSDEASDFRGNYQTYRGNQELFNQFLLEHGASQRLVDFLLKAEELKAQDEDPNSWQGTTKHPDRYEFLQQWLEQQRSLTGQEVVKGEGIEQKSREWAESTFTMAEKVGVNPQNILGPAATLRAEWQYRHGQAETDRQFQAVEMAAQAMPDEKIILQSGFAATNADWIMSCIMVGLMTVGVGIKPIAVLGEWQTKQVGELRGKLALIGENIMANLSEKSTEFKEWVEEVRRKNNSRQLVNRLKNGLSLSREFVFDLGGILNNPQNQDLRDLVLTEGPNWFRHVPESHPEIGQILRFFGCGNYSELRALANQPDRIVNRLYRVLVGRGKRAYLRKTEQVKGLIGLYKEASGFNLKENR